MLWWTLVETLPLRRPSCCKDPSKVTASPSWALLVSILGEQTFVPGGSATYPSAQMHPSHSQFDSHVYGCPFRLTLTQHPTYPTLPSVRHIIQSHPTLKNAHAMPLSLSLMQTHLGVSSVPTHHATWTPVTPPHTHTTDAPRLSLVSHTHTHR